MIANEMVITTHGCNEQNVGFISHARSRLFWSNLAACILHMMLALSAIISTIDKGTLSVPVFWPRAEWNTTACFQGGYGSDIPICPAQGEHNNDQVGKVNFSVVLIISQLITSAFHAFQVHQTRQRDSIYIQLTLRYGIKLYHWIEYTITGALIAWTVAYFSGMLSIHSQLLTLAAQSTLMLLGLLQDVLRYVARRSLLDLRIIRLVIMYTFLIGFSNVLSLWGPSLYRLFIDDAGHDPPAFVKWIVMSEFILYTSFGMAQLVFYTPLIIFSRITRTF